MCAFPVDSAAPETPSRASLPRDQVLRALAEASPIPLLISRKSNGEILYCNEKLASLVGMTAQQLCGRRTPDFYVDPAARSALLDELHASGRVRDRELQIKTASGQVIWTVCNIESLQIGTEALLLSALLDVTRRKEIEASLQQSEARFRGFVENASELVFALDRQALFTYVSPNVSRLLGYVPAQLTGQSFDSLLHADDVPRLWECMEVTRETCDVQPSCEFRMLHEDGSTRWFCSTLAALRDERGGVVGLTGTAHDITPEKQVIAELEAANQSLRDAQLQLLETEKMASLGMLMAGIAHEIRTPLGAVSCTQRTISQALDKLGQRLRESFPEVLADPHVARILKVLCDSARVVGDGSTRASEIVQRLRRFSCSEEAAPCPVDINAIADDTLALIHHELGHDVSICKCFGDGVTLMGYPGRLNQVLVNLLVNAAHAVRAHGGGTIRLETRSRGDQVEIEISDDGMGIPPEHLDQIFASGFTTKAGGEGCGLGLAISKAIVAGHHGHIEVKSQLGRGTTFTVRLPKRQPEKPRGPWPCGSG